MKKIFITSLILLFVACATVVARTQYDSTGRILKDDSLRAQKRAIHEKIHQKAQQIAPAAKINYEQAEKAQIKETKEALFESNYIQDKK